jgi:hypothetical protein
MRIITVLFALAGVLLAGCESIFERVRDRFTPVPPRTQTFAAARDTVSAAVQAAFRQMDFNVTSGASGSAHFEAASAAHPSAAFGDRRQITAEAVLREPGPGQTKVSLLLTEEVESYTGGRESSRQPLRDHPLYERFFATVRRILEQNPAGNGPSVR